LLENASNRACGAKRQHPPPFSIKISEAPEKSEAPEIDIPEAMVDLTISNVLVQSTLVTAAGLSFTSLVAVRRVYRMLSRGLVRATWGVLSLLIGILALGDLALLWINYTQGPNRHEDWLVGSVCLAASLFVVLACILAHHTAKDVSRLSKLESVACIDPVTELYNRRHIMAVLDAECIRSSSHSSPLSILLMDVDNFKKVNDTYGHQAGDVVLKEMGVLISAASGSRLVGRYGGEEFLVLLPQEDAADAWVTAERIRAVIEAAKVVYDGDPIISPTISIGIATTFGWKEKPEDLVGLADEALYAAKSTGRNRTCHAFESSGKRTVSKFSVVSPLNSN
jgi:diguanylate cyclase (GGDEF)-like protein